MRSTIIRAGVLIMLLSACSNAPAAAESVDTTKIESILSKIEKEQAATCENIAILAEHAIAAEGSTLFPKEAVATCPLN
jgi:hypothetical protein